MAVRLPRSADPVFSGLSDKLRELERVVFEQEQRFGAITQIGRAIGSSLDIDEILRQVMELVTPLMEAERSTLYLVDRESGEIWSKVLQGAQIKEIRQPIGKGVAGWVAAKGKVALLNAPYEDSRFNPAFDRQTGFKTRSILAVPLRSRSGEIIGVIQALNKKEGELGPDDEALLTALGGQVAIAIDNAMLYRQMEERNRQLGAAHEALRGAKGELDVLYEIERQISGTQSFPELLDGIIARAMSLTSAEAGSLLLVEEDTGTLFFKSALGEKGEEAKRHRLQVGEGIAGEVAHTGKPVMSDAPTTLDAFDARLCKRIGYSMRSVLCVPVAQEGRTVGALELLNKSGGKGFGEADLRLATLVAGQAARAIMLGKSREEAQRKERLAILGQMVSGMLHDLRTPMTIAGGYAQIMVGEDSRDERQKNCDIILKQFDHMGAMAKETLAFAKGQRQILLSKVYLQKFMEEISEYLKQEFQGKNIELKVAANYTGALRVDELKMKRVIYNLARNAAQAMSDGGKFTLAVDKEGSKVVFALSDTGPGIPEEIADRLFQSFVTQGKKDGTGLGLAIVKKIVEEHGGEVSFKSKPGKGTTFFVAIPG